MFKKYFFIIALLFVGFAIVHAQIPPPVPLSPTPAYTPSNTNPGAPRLNLSRQQMQRLFEIYDQRKYTEAMYNEGRITQNEYDAEHAKSYEDAGKIMGTPTGADQIAWIYTNGDLEIADEKLWVSWAPGWPSAKTMREWLGFSIPSPREPEPPPRQAGA